MLDWFFRDPRTGRIVIAQPPNLSLSIFLVALVAGWVLPAESTAATAADVIGVAALAWWSVDELARGVNPWRRTLGVAGATFAVLGVVRLLT